MQGFEDLFNALPNGIDCALISSDVNRRYFSGMKSSYGFILAFKDKAYLLVDFRYYEKAFSVVKNCEVILLNSFKAQANDILKKHNAKVIAIESNNVTVSQLSAFRSMFSDFEIDSTDNLSSAITAMRSIKSQIEIEMITSAQRIAEKAFDNLLNFICEGKTEREIALQLDFYMLKNGAEALSFDTIALAGKNTSLPHGVPSDTIVKKGDFVLLDFGAVFEGYHSDMTRTVCVGEASEKMQSVYEIVLTAQNAALNGIKSGVSSKEIDKIARDIITEAGYGGRFGHGLGHGVGMEIHEFPNSSPNSDTILEDNMIMTVEPGIYLSDEFGVRIEDFVIIKENGCENITKCVKNLIYL